MTEFETIPASKRQRSGTGGARAARRAGQLPANLYGGGQAPQAISVDPIAVTKTYHHGNFLSTILTLNVDGEQTYALPREVQTHPVKDHILHVDFLRVDERTRINVDVPVHFINEEDSPGLKRGGVINVVRHEVELSCPAMSIPAFIEADLTGLEIGDSIKISAIGLPEGVAPTITDRDFTVATVAAPTLEVVEEEEKEGEEAAEGAPATEGEAADDNKEGEGESGS